MLCKLGYTFSLDDLEVWEVDAYNTIESEIGKLDNKQAKRKK
jgi:hypothetical protein